MPNYTEPATHGRAHLYTNTNVTLRARVHKCVLCVSFVVCSRVGIGRHVFAVAAATTLHSFIIASDITGYTYVLTCTLILIRGLLSLGKISRFRLPSFHLLKSFQFLWQDSYKRAWLRW